jgi:PTS system sucrose-specific IIC component
MAGAGQVGAAFAIYLKAKKVKNERMKAVISGALPAGILGVGEPLIYGVTLPMGKPFITAGLGAGFGGAFVMAMQVAATAWGPSGILACFVMTAGPTGAVSSVACYAVGIVISYIMGFIITNALVKDNEVAEA